MTQSNLVVVTSNCVTAGIATAIQQVCPGLRVLPLTIAELENTVAVQNALSAAQVWITAFRPELADAPPIQAKNPSLKVCRIPPISFSAFHPDICYVRNRHTNEMIEPHYNSRIVVWAYNKNLSVEQTLALFAPQVQASIGYLSRWDAEVAQLQRQFDRSDLKADFAVFYQRLRRMGCFMYSINHPKVELIVHLARIIVKRLGLACIDEKADILFSDVLDNINWPVYPPVAAGLGLGNGSYVFKLSERTIAPSLQSFVRHSFAHYQKLGLSAGDMKYEHPEPKGFSEAMAVAASAVSVSSAAGL